MGVSVRLSRNARVYLPFWVALPAYMIVAAVWLVVVVVCGVMWLIAAAIDGVRYWRAQAASNTGTRRTDG